MCIQVIERYSVCKCLYHKHAVDHCAARDQDGHVVQEKTVLVGYDCDAHSALRTRSQTTSWRPETTDNQASSEMRPEADVVTERDYFITSMDETDSTHVALQAQNPDSPYHPSAENLVARSELTTKKTIESSAIPSAEYTAHHPSRNGVFGKQESAFPETPYGRIHDPAPTLPPEQRFRSSQETRQPAGGNGFSKTIKSHAASRIPDGGHSVHRFRLNTSPKTDAGQWKMEAEAYATGQREMEAKVYARADVAAPALVVASSPGSVAHSIGGIGSSSPIWDPSGIFKQWNMAYGDGQAASEVRNNTNSATIPIVEPNIWQDPFISALDSIDGQQRDREAAPALPSYLPHQGLIPYQPAAVRDPRYYQSHHPIQLSRVSAPRAFGREIQLEQPADITCYRQATPSAHTHYPSNSAASSFIERAPPPSTSIQPSPHAWSTGPMPATTPLVVRQDDNGIQWLSFEYSRDRVKMEYYTIRCDADSVNCDQLNQEFKSANCVYPGAFCEKDQYKGNRLHYESECNAIGWALALLNPVLREKQGLIKRAVDSWRNSNQDVRLRSRRARRMAKIQNNNNAAKQGETMPGPEGQSNVGPSPQELALLQDVVVSDSAIEAPQSTTCTSEASVELLESPEQGAPVTSMAYTVGHTIADSGYASAAQQRDDVDEDTASVSTDKQHSGLRADIKEQLISNFVEELSNGLEHPVADAPGLQALLRDYAIMLRESNINATESKAATFVKNNSSGIARRFHDETVADDRSNDDVSIDRIALLWGSEHHVYHDQGSGEAIEHLREIDVHENDLPPEVPAARKFLFENAEFDWLSANIRKLGLGTGLGTDRRVRGILVSHLAKAARRQQSIKPFHGNATEKNISTRRFVHAELDIGWCPRSFLKEQYGQWSGVDLGSVIVVCGVGDEAQALTCQEYATWRWGKGAHDLIRALNIAIREGAEAHARTLPDETHLEVKFESQSTMLEVKGDLVSVLELSEVLIWLGCACRASPRPNDIMHCIPTVRAQQSREELLSLDITYHFENTHRESAACWKGMLRNPAIAHGYPIATRPDDARGLEISLDMMSALGQAARAVEFDSTLLLKGISTAFAAVVSECHHTAWHFLKHADGERMSYNHASTFAGKDIAFSALKSERHFVGWTPDAKILTGTKHARYEFGLSESAPAKAGVCALSGLSIGASKVVGVNASFSIGRKDTLVLKSEDPFEIQIGHARQMNVLLYGTNDRRGWLIPGDHALIHICRSWLSSEAALDADIPLDTIQKFGHVKAEHRSRGPLMALKAQANRDLPLIRRSPAATIKSVLDIDEGATKLSQESTETTWRFEDLVQLKWQALEQIHDHLAKLNSKPPELKWPKGRSVLEGFEMADIVSGRQHTRARMVELPSSAEHWVKFTQKANVITLLAEDFGDLILPLQSQLGHRACKRLSPMPRDQHYLAAPLSVVKQISSEWRCKRGNRTCQLGDSVFWCYDDHSFQPCDCTKRPGQCSATVASLRTLPKKDVKQPQHKTIDIFTAHPNGAVIFGSNVIAKAPKRKRMEEEHERQSQRARGSDSAYGGSSGMSDLGASSSTSAGSGRRS